MRPNFPGVKLSAKQSRRYGFAFVLIALLIGLYLGFEWNRYERIASSEAVMLAQSLEALLDPEQVAKLSGTPEDLKKTEYNLMKTHLKQLVETTNPIYFAYLMGEREGNLVFLIDSEPPASPNYSPPGQVYTEASDIYYAPFRAGKTILTSPTTDRWGTWISVLVPIKDTKHEQVIAVLGIDYSASAWNSNIWQHMTPHMIVGVSILIIFFALLVSLIQGSRLKKLSQKLAFDEALYHCVFDQAPVGIAVGTNESHAIQPEWEHFYMNSAFEKILGRASHELFNMKWTEITHPEDVQTDLEKFQQFTAGEMQGYSLEKRYIKPDGSSIWTNMIIAPFINPLSGNSKHICLLEDISKRKEAEELLRESERSKSVLIANLPGLAYRCSYESGGWTMQFASAGCFALTGYTAESLLEHKNLSFDDLISPKYQDSLWEEHMRALAGRLPLKYEYEIITASGEHKWVLEMGQGIYNNQGDVEAFEGVVFDISNRKRMEDQLKHNNDHDFWTGLYNRQYLHKFLSVALESETENKALVGINLSSIHVLSLTYGFQYSHELIKKVVEALSVYCTESCQLFSTNENRFVFYVESYKDKNDLQQFCETVVATLEPILTPERIGGVLAILMIDESNRHDMERLLKNLLVASERVMNAHEKDFGICFLDQTMEAQIIRENEISQELAQIVAGEDSSRLFLQYQPIFDLRSNQISGFEALARLSSHRFGNVSPVEFIPIAEKTKYIIPLGNEIIFQALNFLRKLNEAGFQGILVSINISVIQLLRSEFTTKLFETIKKLKVNPADIGLEITESVFASSYEDINRILGELKEYGLKIALDDFGTGHSSFAHERELNINCLKIDKSFIDNLVSLPEDQAITSDIISMAHKLGHYVIAEGIEHERQLQYLKHHGCDKVQGYLMGRPLDEETSIELVKKQKRDSI